MMLVLPQVDSVKKFWAWSLVLHGVMAVGLLIPKGFDVLIWLGLKDPSISILISRSMRVDVLDLPDLEATVERAKQQALPKSVRKKAKVAKKPKSKKADKAEVAKTSSRKDIIERMRKRAGNVLQEGEDVLSPAVAVAGSAFEGDPFWLTLEQTIKKHWQVPPHLKQSELAVTFNVKVSAAGEVVGASLVQASTRSDYDAFVSDFVSQQLVLELEIPHRFQGLLANDGVNITFSP